MILLIGTSIKGFVSYYDSPDRENWKKVASFVSQRGATGDVVMFYAYFLKIPFEYYFGRPDIAKKEIKVIDIASAPWRGHSGSTSDLPDPDMERIRTLGDRYRRVWLVLGYDRSIKLGRDTEREQIQNEIEKWFTLSSSYDFADIRLNCYTSNGSDLR